MGTHKFYRGWIYHVTRFAEPRSPEVVTATHSFSYVTRFAKPKRSEVVTNAHSFDTSSRTLTRDLPSSHKPTDYHWRGLTFRTRMGDAFAMLYGMTGSLNKPHKNYSLTTFL